MLKKMVKIKLQEMNKGAKKPADLAMLLHLGIVSP